MVCRCGVRAASEHAARCGHHLCRLCSASCLLCAVRPVCMHEAQSCSAMLCTVMLVISLGPNGQAAVSFCIHAHLCYCSACNNTSMYVTADGEHLACLPFVTIQDLTVLCHMDFIITCVVVLSCDPCAARSHANAVLLHQGHWGQ